MADNQTMMQYFEWYLPSDQLLWKEVACQAKSLAEHGITTMWLPPAYKGTKGKQDVGYGVYDTYDLGEFNQKGSVGTKYGTREEYLTAIRALHEQGMTVLGDIVFNHRIGADEAEDVIAAKYSLFDRTELEEEEKKISAWTKYTFPGRNGKYSDFTWNWTHFDGTDYDAKTGERGIFQFHGKKWDSDVDPQYGNYDYLMGTDLDMDNPVVIEELLNWGKWYIETTGVDGFRLDAVKHIQFDYFTGWLSALSKYFHRDIFAVGEYWSSDIEALLYYIEKSKECMRLFDVPLHDKMNAISRGNHSIDMSKLFEDTLTGIRPDLSVTFVDNHDTQYGQALESWVESWFKPIAYSIILLQDKGLPCIFYGDYYGVPCQHIAPVQGLKTLLRLRKCYAYGQQTDYTDTPHVLGFTRAGDDEHPNSGLAVLLSDLVDGEQKMTMGSRFAGKTFRDCLHHRMEPVILDKTGTGVFHCTSGSVSVWVEQSVYEILTLEKEC